MYLPNQNITYSFKRGTLDLYINELVLFRTCYRAENLGITLPADFDVDYLSTITDQGLRDFYITSKIDYSTLMSYKNKIQELAADEDRYYLMFDTVVVRESVSDGPSEFYEALIFIENDFDYQKGSVLKALAFSSQSGHFLTAAAFDKPTFENVENTGFFYIGKYL